MRRVPPRALASSLLPALLALAAVMPHARQAHAPERMGATLEKSQLVFEEDAGRTGHGVRYIARAGAMTLFVRDRGSVVVLGGRRHALVTTTLVGASPATTRGTRRLPGVVNSYVGPHSRWRTGLPSYASVRAGSVYPGIDLSYHGRRGRLEYDFRVQPGADPARIAMAIGGVRGLHATARGDLIMSTRAGTLRQVPPVAMQGGRRIAAAFDIAGRTVGFRLGRYDHRRALVIDPQLAYSTFLGGSADESAGYSSLAVDGGGNVYVAGETGSSDFPGAGNRGGGFDAVLTKLSADGKTPLYSTYFGTSGIDNGNAVAVDSSGNAFLAGTTDSASLPGRSGGAQASLAAGSDGFVAKFDGSGALQQSTYLGGDGSDFTYGIALDASGNPYVAGETSSTNFPTGPLVPTPVIQPNDPDAGELDAFVTKFAPTLKSRTWSTYLGGTAGDYANAIAVGPDGSAYVTGITYSQDFPMTNATDSTFYSTASPPNGSAEAFVTRLAPDATSRVYSTFIGGDGEEQGNGIAVDGNGNAYVAGYTSSTNTGDGPLPYFGQAAGQTDNAGLYDAVIAKLAPDGAFSYVGWYGGSGDDGASSVSFDAQGNSYFAGSTVSTDLTVTPNVPQPHLANQGTDDAWVLKVGNGFPSYGQGQLVWATYLGGTSGDSASTILADGSGGVWVAGTTVSDSFPVTADALQPGRAGGSDFWLARLVMSPVTINSGPDGTLRSHDASFTYASKETNATYECRLSPVEANFSSCPVIGKTYKALADGSYRFEVSVTDPAGTTSPATARDFVVDTNPIAAFAIAPNPALIGTTVTFDGSGSSGASQALVEYEWDLDGDGVFERNTGTTARATQSYLKPGDVTIRLRVTDQAGKTASSTGVLHMTKLPTGTLLGVTINKGAKWTNTPKVVVSASFPASTTSMLFSNDGGFLDPTTFAPQKSVPWTLDSTGPERLPKTIYVRFLAGTIPSETFQDDIILDETAPKVQQAVVAPATAAASMRTARGARLAIWKVRVKATDSNSGVGRIQVTSNKRKPGRLLRYRRKLTVKSTTRPKWIRARDRAGNYSKWRRARG